MRTCSEHSKYDFSHLSSHIVLKAFTFCVHPVPFLKPRRSSKTCFDAGGENLSNIGYLLLHPPRIPFGAELLKRPVLWANTRVNVDDFLGALFSCLKRASTDELST